MAGYYSDLRQRFDRHVHQVLAYVGRERLRMRAGFAARP